MLSLTKKRMSVRVRFAPSPTGALHIGGLRTALYNYLLAKKNDGKFILRIEDTDQNRKVDQAEAYITEALSWCGLEPDESPSKPGSFGPYRQSERKQVYQKYIQELIEKGKAYYAFDTPEELSKIREVYELEKKTFKYGIDTRMSLKNSLSLSSGETEEALNTLPYVVRLKIDSGKNIKVKDGVRGYIEVKSEEIDDKILMKADGMPTYHFANVVDDHLMEITHVIRGEEWLPSLALHQLLYTALGWEAPEFAHLPLILKPTGKGKLSKRDGDKLGFPVFPLNWTDPSNNSISKGYKESGYFAEAVINFLAFLGWNPGTEQEVFSLSELVESFDLKNVNKAGARFDPDKTKWFNHQYMQKAELKDLTSSFISATPELASIDPGYVELVVNLIKERATFPSDFWGLSHYFFKAPENFAEAALRKAWKEHSKDLMLQLIAALETADDSSVETLQTAVKGWITQNEIGFGKIMMPLRVALVGALEGVDVFDIIYLIGKSETIKRIQTLIDQH